MNRHSKHRTRTRRAHHALTVVQVTTCAKCQTEVLPHRVCKVCGTYSGRQVLDVDKSVAKKLKKATTAKKEA